MTHYRQPIDWTKAASEQAASALDTFRHLTEAAGAADGKVAADVLAALGDDLNTPQAIAGLHRLADEARKGDGRAASDLFRTCGFLGIDLKSVSLQDILKRRKGDIDEARVEGLIAERNAARKAKNFKESDRIRDELAAMGIVLKDSKDGTTWEVKR